MDFNRSIRVIRKLYNVLKLAKYLLKKESSVTPKNSELRSGSTSVNVIWAAQPGFLSTCAVKVRVVRNFNRCSIAKKNYMHQISLKSKYSIHKYQSFKKFKITYFQIPDLKAKLDMRFLPDSKFFWHCREKPRQCAVRRPIAANRSAAK